MSERGLTHVVINLVYSVSSAVYLEGGLLSDKEHSVRRDIHVQKRPTQRNASLTRSGIRSSLDMLLHVRSSDNRGLAKNEISKADNKHCSKADR
ncbi:hypothetical protein GX48_01014 [Paracoccidioides brasiliensis]|nr:hypothetical protein GX48_01014 [Paracoccidioides brasiliensis]